jgi:hypothetical protein
MFVIECILFGICILFIGCFLFYYILIELIIAFIQITLFCAIVFCFWFVGTHFNSLSNRSIFYPIHRVE